MTAYLGDQAIDSWLERDYVFCDICRPIDNPGGGDTSGESTTPGSSNTPPPPPPQEVWQFEEFETGPINLAYTAFGELGRTGYHKSVWRHSTLGKVDMVDAIPKVMNVAMFDANFNIVIDVSGSKELGSDNKVATTRSTFKVAYSGIGWVPGTTGGPYYMRHLIESGRAVELAP